MPREKITKYEVARIIGMRAAQLGMSAPILTDSQNNCANFIHIAATELKQGMLDIIIQRPLPMGKSYEVNIKDLDPPDDLDAIVSLFSDNSVAR